MPSATRAVDIGTHRAQRQMLEIGHEFRERRLQLGLSHEHVAGAARIPRLRYGQLEAGKPVATILELNRIAAVLGLDVWIRVYPGGPAVRDAGQSTRLYQFLRLAAPPLTRRVEVPLPAGRDRLELRAWDAVLSGHGARTAIELEMRLRDVQALRRRVDLKRRDDPTESFLLLVADTRANRHVLAEFAELFADLPRLKPSVVRGALERGDHPPAGLLLIPG